jgi:hypothetical protein
MMDSANVNARPDDEGHRRSSYLPWLELLMDADADSVDETGDGDVFSLVWTRCWTKETVRERGPEAIAMQKKRKNNGV